MPDQSPHPELTTAQLIRVAAYRPLWRAFMELKEVGIKARAGNRVLSPGRCRIDSVSPDAIYEQARDELAALDLSLPELIAAAKGDFPPASFVAVITALASDSLLELAEAQDHARRAVKTEDIHCPDVVKRFVRAVGHTIRVDVALDCPNAIEPESLAEAIAWLHDVRAWADGKTPASNSAQASCGDQPGATTATGGQAGCDEELVADASDGGGNQKKESREKKVEVGILRCRQAGIKPSSRNIEKHCGVKYTQVTKTDAYRSLKQGSVRESIARERPLTSAMLYSLPAANTKTPQDIAADREALDSLLCCASDAERKRMLSLAPEDLQQLVELASTQDGDC